ncbi:hypothetical protein [Citrobacter freundii]|uniref:hypothetical protein n=1 Tax=Citrobacter freundii TaxID=546 RepID=UPI00388F95A9
MGGGVLVDVVAIICVFWVFFDASSHNIGSYVVTDGIQKGYRKGLHPVVWAILSFLILLPFFLYLLKRKALLKTAKEYPAVTDKSISFIVLLLLVAAWTLHSYREFLFY